MTDSKPTTYSELYPGRFLHADNFKGKTVTLTIADVFLEVLEGERGKERKAVLAFEQTPLLYVLPKINGECIKAMWGPNVTGWLGKRIALYPTNKIMPMPRRRGDRRPPDECIRVWGSPDIGESITVEFRPPRRKAIVMTLHAMRAAMRPDSRPEPPPAEEMPDAGDVDHI